MSKARYVTGLRAVEQLLATPGSDVRRIFAEYRTPNPRVQAIIDAANARGIDVQPANRARLQQLSGEVRHQGVVAEVRRSSMLDEAGLRGFVEQRLTEPCDRRLLVLILEAIQDPHNLGACLRTADAAGVDAVVMPRHGAAGISPTVSKVSAGAAENLRIATVANIGRVLGWLSDYGVAIVGTSDTGSLCLFDTDLSAPLALVMGGEHGGLSKSVAGRCDRLVHLPMHGAVASLNVSVATGVCLYEALRQRRSSLADDPQLG